jgi:hypothetical protein
MKVTMLFKQCVHVATDVYVLLGSTHLQKGGPGDELPIPVEDREAKPGGSHVTAFVNQYILAIVNALLQLCNHIVLAGPRNEGNVSVCTFD